MILALLVAAGVAAATVAALYLLSGLDAETARFTMELAGPFVFVAVGALLAPGRRLAIATALAVAVVAAALLLARTDSWLTTVPAYEGPPRGTYAPDPDGPRKALVLTSAIGAAMGWWVIFLVRQRLQRSHWLEVAREAPEVEGIPDDRLGELLRRFERDNYGWILGYSILTHIPLGLGICTLVMHRESLPGPFWAWTFAACGVLTFAYYGLLSLRPRLVRARLRAFLARETAPGLA